jgi:hypothetical protein
MTTRKKTTTAKKAVGSAKKPTEQWGYFTLGDEIDTDISDYVIDEGFNTRSEAIAAATKSMAEANSPGFGIVHATFYKRNITLEQF